MIHSKFKTPATRFILQKTALSFDSSRLFFSVDKKKEIDNQNEYVTKNEFIAVTQKHEEYFQMLLKNSEFQNNTLEKHSVLLEKQAGELEKHSVILEKQASELEWHSVILEKQGRELEKHSVILEKQASELERHSVILEKQGKELETLESGQRSIRRQLAQISVGLGKGFEKYNAAWVNFYLKEKGYKEADIKLGTVFIDLNRVINPASTEFEVDILCVDPFLVGEATSFFDEKEMNKLEKFIKISAYLENLYKKKPKLFFFAAAIDTRIMKRFKELCTKK